MPANNDYLLLIKKHLPEDVWEIAQRLSIPTDFLASMPDLIELILRSKSMDKDEEKQSWCNLLPLMNDEQIAKLRDILTREKQKLAEIEKKYEQKKVDIKKKYLMRRQHMGYIKKMQGIQDQESAHREEELAAADDLLENI